MSTLTIERPKIDPLDRKWVNYRVAAGALPHCGYTLYQLARRDVVRFQRTGGRAMYFFPDVIGVHDRLAEFNRA